MLTGGRVEKRGSHQKKKEGIVLRRKRRGRCGKSETDCVGDEKGGPSPMKG